MQYLGFFLLAFGLVAGLFGFLQKRKAKKILAAPFKKTGDITLGHKAGNVQGVVSCEGKVEATEPLIAPCSKQACLYYEITIERHWEKTETTEDGNKTQKGKSRMESVTDAKKFAINDGSGACWVDAKEGLDADLQKSHESKISIGSRYPGELVFGDFHYTTPHVDGDTTAFSAVERVLPAQGSLFVMGKLVNGALAKPDGITGKLLVSTKGRDRLVGATNRNANIGWVVGGLLLVGGGLLAAFTEPPKRTSCKSMMQGTLAEACTDRVTSTNTYTWQVPKTGVYTVKVLPPKKRIPFFPRLTIKKDGVVVATSSGTGETAIEQSFEEGTYRVSVEESTSLKVKGGYSYAFLISGAAAPTASGSPAPN